MTQTGLYKSRFFPVYI